MGSFVSMGDASALKRKIGHPGIVATRHVGDDPSDFLEVNIRFHFQSLSTGGNPSARRGFSVHSLVRLLRSM
jgi:hypothetical protein